jgi:hypothetical protein
MQRFAARQPPRAAAVRCGMKHSAAPRWRRCTRRRPRMERVATDARGRTLLMPLQKFTTSQRPSVDARPFQNATHCSAERSSSHDGIFGFRTPCPRSADDRIATHDSTITSGRRMDFSPPSLPCDATDCNTVGDPGARVGCPRLRVRATLPNFAPGQSDESPDLQSAPSNFARARPRRQHFYGAPAPNRWTEARLVEITTREAAARLLADFRSRISVRGLKTGNLAPCAV